jgi:anthranilate synthase component 2
MQAIAEVFGGELYNLVRPVHGRATEITVLDEQEKLFMNCPRNFNVGRYHSWAVKNDQVPEVLKVTASDSEHVIMALRHRSLDVRGVQFHPESVLTEHGKAMISNWLS